jgi:hypothetical protein
MASPTNSSPSLSPTGQETAHTFLSLAPTTSASYPVAKSPPKSPVQAPTIPTQQTTSAETVSAVIPESVKTRRSSSLSSDGSAKRRFLKLGPVHGGEAGEGLGDWSEDVLA